MSVLSIIKELGQEVHCEFKASVSYIMRFCITKLKEKGRKERKEGGREGGRKEGREGERETETETVRLVFEMPGGRNYAVNRKAELKRRRDQTQSGESGLP